MNGADISQQSGNLEIIKFRHILNLLKIRLSPVRVYARCCND